MEASLGLIVGLLFFAGVLLVLAEDLIRFVVGLSVLSNGVNLLVFAAGRLTRGTPPILEEAGSAVAADPANPLSQALILTAIVISFGLQAFMLALAYRCHTEFGTIDFADLNADPEDGP